jgi:tellurite resistance protein
MAAYLEDREDELLDAVITAAALVARADGWIQHVECGQLLDFLDREELLSVFSREEALDAFRRCIRELREPGGPTAAVERLRRHAGRAPVRLVVGVGEEVAAADCRLDPREERILAVIRTAVGAQPSPLAPGHLPPGVPA